MRTLERLRASSATVIRRRSEEECEQAGCFAEQLHTLLDEGCSFGEDLPSRSVSAAEHACSPQAWDEAAMHGCGRR